MGSAFLALQAKVEMCDAVEPRSTSNNTSSGGTSRSSPPSRSSSSSSRSSRKNRGTQEISKEHSDLKAEESMPRSCPVFHEADIGELGDKDWKRHIRISCPGLSEDAVDIQRVPNGVHVIITESDVDGDCHRSFGLKSRILFDKEFHYDHRVFGCLNLCEDECSFNDGVLNLVLKRS